MKLLASLACALFLASCADPLPPNAAGDQSEAAKFAASCLRFAELVSDLSLQRRLGTISDDLYEEINPFVTVGDATCNSDVITDYGEASNQIEDILVDIAEAQQ